MEYILGAAIAIATILVTKFFITKHNDIYIPQVNYTQTTIFEVVKPFLPDDAFEEEPIETQSSKFQAKLYLTILVIEDEAYWIKENTFYKAQIIDGDIDQDSATPVDTMAMDKVQLDKMISIIETLTKGKPDDYWDSK